MDTHISPNPLFDNEGAVRCARLPGEPDPAAASHEQAAPLRADDPRPASSAPPRRNRRHRLLIGVAVIGFGAAGSGVFLVSPYNHVVPVPRQVMATVHRLEASAGINLESPLAPSASLARVNLPPAPRAVLEPRYVPQPAATELSELMRLHASAGPSTAQSSRPSAPPAVKATPRPPAAPLAQVAAMTPARPQAAVKTPAGPPPGYVPHEPGAPQPPVVTTEHPAVRGEIGNVSAPPVPAAEGPVGAAAASTSGERKAVPVTPPGLAASSPSLSATSVRDGSPSPALATGQGPSTERPTAHAADSRILGLKDTRSIDNPVPVRGPLAVAQQLEAAPISPPQQVQVIELVTQIATLVRDQGKELSELRGDVARSDAATAVRLSDFERRLAMAEARKAMAAAVAATNATSPEPVTAVPQAPAPPPVALTKAAAGMTAPMDQVRKSYRLQAASPGLAMLAEVDRGGGTGAQIEIQVGDVIPGYGRVKSIAQHGTAWVVTTENGTIQ
jgi:hypothetical protein